MYSNNITLKCKEEPSTKVSLVESILSIQNSVKTLKYEIFNYYTFINRIDYLTNFMI